MKGITNENNYKAIADAIREKNGSDTKYLPSEMADAIKQIFTGFMDDELVEQLVDLNQVVLQSIIDAKAGRVGGLSNVTSYSFTPPFIIKKRTIDGSKSGPRFRFSNVLNIDMDVLFSPTIFSENALASFFTEMNSKIKRKIKLGVTHDYTNITSVAACFQDAYLSEIDWGSLASQAKNITNFTQMFYGANFLEEIDFSEFNTRAGLNFTYLVGTSGGHVSPKISKILGLDWYNATTLNQVARNIRCDIYAINWRLCDLNLPNTTMSGDAVCYIIEHACGEEDGAAARTFIMDSSTKKNFQAHPQYEYYIAMAAEKLITIA